MATTRQIQRQITASSNNTALVSKNVVSVVPAVTTSLDIDTTVHDLVHNYSPSVAKQIPLGPQASFIKKIVLILTPLFLAFGWVAFFKAVRRLSEAKEQRAERWMDVGVSFVSAAGMTLALAFIFAGVVYGAPYLLAAILGLNALQGLYYTVKSLVSAWKDKGNRWQHLKEAGKHFLGIAINTLAMVLNIFVFQAAELIKGGIKEYASSFIDIIMNFEAIVSFIKGPVITALNNIKGVALAWLAVFLAAVVQAAVKINEENWVMLVEGSNPKTATFELEALEDIGKILGLIGDRKTHPLKRFLLALTSPLTIPLYVAAMILHTVVVRPLAALVLGLPQLLFVGLWRGMKKIFCPEKPEPLEDCESGGSVGLAFEDSNRGALPPQQGRGWSKPSAAGAQLSQTGYFKPPLVPSPELSLSSEGDNEETLQQAGVPPAAERTPTPLPR